LYVLFVSRLEMTLILQESLDPETVEFLESLIESNELKSTMVRRASTEASLVYEWISRLPRYYRLKESIPPERLEESHPKYAK
jgi:hypothetical protein